MGEIVNLNRARKARARKKAEETAVQNRAAFGRSKGERQTEAKRREKADRFLEGHRKDDGDP